jgi:hypothetical protein
MANPWSAAASVVSIAYNKIPRFPVLWVVDSPRVESGIVKAIWFVIPLEYYLVTSSSAGFPRNAFGAAAIFVLLYIILLFGISSLLATIGRREFYERRLRIWSISLIVTWGATVALVALAHFLSSLREGRHNDLVADIICQPSCVPEYPAPYGRTILIYAIYSAIALLILEVLSRRRPASQASSSNNNWYQPDVIAVVAINALTMTAMHAYANSG